jgi:HK97 family phage portal protein
LPNLLSRALSRIRTVSGTFWNPPPATRGGWAPIIREPYTGAWQANQELTPESVYSNPTVFRCISVITTDISKCRLRLVRLDADGVWSESTNPAYTPVLRRPNRYQLIGQFIDAWMTARLLFANVYVYKERDARGVVKALYVLDSAKVVPLVAPDGAVYYELQRNDLAGLVEDPAVVIPASEIIHDRWNCLFHPLVGIPPLFACGGAAQQATKIQDSSTTLFANGARPAGVLTIPGAITDQQAQRAIDQWQAAQVQLGPGRTAVVSHGATYQAITQNATDSQLTEQLKWSANTIAGVFGVPVSMVDSSQQPPYANSEASLLQYHSQCLQAHMTAIEAALDDGLELDPSVYGTEFDIDDLVWMDTQTKTQAAREAIGSGAMAPNEARFKYFGLGPVPGGDSPFMQQQYFALEALADRPAPNPQPPPPPPPPTVPAPEPEDEDEEVNA